MKIFVAVINFDNGLLTDSASFVARTPEGLNVQIAEYCLEKDPLSVYAGKPPAELVESFFEDNEASYTLHRFEHGLEPLSQQDIVQSLYMQQWAAGLDAAIKDAGCAHQPWEALKSMTVEELGATLSQNGVCFSCLSNDVKSATRRRFEQAAETLIKADPFL